MEFPYVGAFTSNPRVRNDFATIVSLNEEGAVVEWMSFNGELAHDFVSHSDLGPADVPLPIEVFCQRDDGESDSWVVASITHCHRLPDGQIRWKAIGAGVNRLFASEQIRFTQSATRVDVLSAAARVQFDTPRYYQHRRDFLDEYRDQLRLSRGLQAMLSAPIDLYEHQLEVVERVLTDPIPKFILADEVGLGKTVEAGIVLKQRDLDRARSASLVIVPDHLAAQWESELIRRFGFAEELKEKSIVVLPYSDYVAHAEAVARRHWSEVIVDEAHKAARWGQLADGDSKAAYEVLRTLCEAAEVVLLLSATPQETDSGVLLCLLELLDSAEWSRDSRAKFRTRQELRHLVTNTLELLSPEDVVLLDRSFEEILKYVDPEAPLHAVLSQALADIESDKEFTDEEIHRIRTYLNEGCRLHSRLIRSTRKDSNVLQVWRRWDSFNGAVDPDTDWGEALRRAERVAEDWRVAAMTSGAAVRDTATAYAGLLVAIASSESAISEWVRLRREPGYEPSCDWRALVGEDVAEAVRRVPSVGFEEETLDRLEGVCEADAIRGGKMRAALDVARHRVLKRQESVVFMASAPGMAGALAEALELECGGSASVYCLDGSASPERLVDAAESLWRSSPPSILCCSSRVEEGGNLQGARHLVHVDVPRLPSRIEQRIGRLDRIGQRGPISQEALLAPVEDSVASRFREAVESVFRTFSAPMSGLHVVEVEALSVVEGAMLHASEGEPEFDRDELSTRIRAEVNRLAREREIDAAGLGGVGSGMIYAGLLSHDQDWKQIHDRWSRQLGFILGIDLVRGPHRSGATYRIPRHGTKAPLPDSIQERLVRALGLPTSPRSGTYYRSRAAEEHGMDLRRIGDDLIELVHEVLDCTNRGKIYGVQRIIRRECWDALGEDCKDTPAILLARFDYEMRSGIAEHLGVDENLGRRLRASFPTRDIWGIVGLSGGELGAVVGGDLGRHSNFIQECAAWADLREEPYKSRRSFAITSDLGLHKGRFDGVLSQFMEKSEWGDAIRIAEEAARLAVAESEILNAAIYRARRDFEMASARRSETLVVRGAPDRDQEAERLARSSGLAAIRDYQIDLAAVGIFSLVRGPD